MRLPFLDRALDYIIGNAQYRATQPKAQKRPPKGKLGEVRSVLDFGARNDGNNDDARRNRIAIQHALDVLKQNRGGTLYFPEGVYLIDAPLILEKKPLPDPNPDEEYNNWLHLLGHSAVIKKGEPFTGDRLLTIFAGHGDEDSIIVEGLVFNGVDRSVNGVDWFSPTVDYREKAPAADASMYTKHVNFDKCIFTFCYVGARVHGNSNSFVQCQFRGNHCGTFITQAGNDIKFLGCSFRVGDVGADITTIDSALGTCGINFFGCIFEDHKMSGLRNKGGVVSVHGGYFEANGIQGGVDKYAEGLYDLSDQDVWVKHGAAIHHEVSVCTGSLSIYGTFFSVEDLYATALSNCFVDCRGGLTIRPTRYGNEDVYQPCTFGPTFLHGSVFVEIAAADDVRDGECFVLNNEKKVISTGAEEKFINAF